MLTRSEIEDYQRIHRSIYHTDITYEVAQEQGTKLIVLLEAVIRPK